MNIFITGGSGGIGKNLINHYNQRKNKLLITCKSKKSLIDLKKIKKKAQIKIVRYDLSSNSETLKLAKQAKLFFKTSLDILINNAGTNGEVELLYNLNLKKWVDTINLNLTAPFILSKEMIPLLKKKKGSIFNICGGGAIKAEIGMSVYGASKCGLARLSEVMSLDLKNKNINVYAISPGMFNTNIHKSYLKFLKKYNSNNYKNFTQKLKNTKSSFKKISDLIEFLQKKNPRNLSGKLLSAQFDEIQTLKKIETSPDNDIFTLRRIDNIFFEKIIKTNSN